MVQSTELKKINSDFSPSLFRDSRNLISAECLAIVIALASQVVLTRSISQEEYGAWIIIFDLSMVSFMFLDPGISTIVGREIQDELQSVRKVLTSTLIIQLTISLALLPFVVLIPLDLLTNGYNIPDVTSLLLCGAAFMFCFSSSHKAFLRTLGRSDIEAKIRVLDRLTLFVGYVFLWRTGGSVYDFSLTIFVIQAVTLSVIIFNCFSICKKIEDSLGKSQSGANFNPVSMIKRALPFFLFMAMMQVADRTDKIFLALSVSPEDIATYACPCWFSLQISVHVF